MQCVVSLLEHQTGSCSFTSRLAERGLWEGSGVPSPDSQGKSEKVSDLRYTHSRSRRMPWLLMTPYYSAECLRPNYKAIPAEVLPNLACPSQSIPNLLDLVALCTAKPCPFHLDLGPGYSSFLSYLAPPLHPALFVSLQVPACLSPPPGILPCPEMLICLYALRPTFANICRCLRLCLHPDHKLSEGIPFDPHLVPTA